MLGQTYCAILTEFADSELTNLRLLPVSGGIFAGAYLERMAELTVTALQLGFGMLSAEKLALLAVGRQSGGDSPRARTPESSRSGGNCKRGSWVARDALANAFAVVRL